MKGHMWGSINGHEYWCVGEYKPEIKHVLLKEAVVDYWLEVIGFIDLNNFHTQISFAQQEPILDCMSWTFKYSY